MNELPKMCTKNGKRKGERSQNGKRGKGKCTTGMGTAERRLCDGNAQARSTKQTKKRRTHANHSRRHLLLLMDGWSRHTHTQMAQRSAHTHTFIKWQNWQNGNDVCAACCCYYVSKMHQMLRHSREWKRRRGPPESFWLNEVALPAGRMGRMWMWMDVAGTRANPPSMPAQQQQRRPICLRLSPNV